MSGNEGIQCGFDGCERTKDVREVVDREGNHYNLCRPCRDEWPEELAEVIYECQFCPETHDSREDHEEHVERMHYAELLRSADA